jgi:hypothetical protein
MKPRLQPLLVICGDEDRDMVAKDRWDTKEILRKCHEALRFSIAFALNRSQITL